MFNIEEIKLEEETKCRCPQALVVDDESFNLEIGEGFLENLGVSPIDICFNGRDAFNMVM